MPSSVESSSDPFSRYKRHFPPDLLRRLANLPTRADGLTDSIYLVSCEVYSGDADPLFCIDGASPSLSIANGLALDAFLKKLEQLNWFDDQNYWLYARREQLKAEDLHFLGMQWEFSRAGELSFSMGNGEGEKCFVDVKLYHV